MQKWAPTPERSREARRRLDSAIAPCPVGSAGFEPDDVSARPWARHDRRVGQIAADKPGAVEVLDLGKAKAASTIVQGGGVEIAAKGLAACGDPLGHLGVKVPRRGFRDPGGRVGVVEDHSGPAWPPGKFAKRREHRVLGQIGRDAEPKYEGARPRVEPGR